MSPSARRAAWALGLSAALALAWALGGARLKRQRAERELFYAYVRGPLSGLCMGLSRGEPAHARQSAAELEALLAQAGPGRLRERLEALLGLHRNLASSPRELPALIARLEELREFAFKSWKMPQERWLELNALIYSLKELQT